MTPTAKTAVVVLGVHRSGTSALTRILSLSGLSLAKTLMPAGPDNPKGFWESLVVMRLNDELLSTRDAAWDEVFPIEEGGLGADFGGPYLARAVEVLREEFGDSPAVVLKDPRICLLADFWKHALGTAGYDARFILAVRHPLEVAASLAARNAISRDRAMLMWLTHMLSAEAKTRADPRVVVTFDAVFADPHAELDRISDRLGLPLPRRGPAASLDIERTIDSDLRHHLAAPSFGGRSELDRLVGATYDWFARAAADQTPDTGILDTVRTKLSAHEEVVGGVLQEFKSRIRQLERDVQGLARERHELVVRLTESELRGSVRAAGEPSDVAAQEAEITALRSAHDGLAAERDQLRTALTAESARAAELERAATQLAQALQAAAARYVELARRADAAAANRAEGTIAADGVVKATAPAELDDVETAAASPIDAPHSTLPPVEEVVHGGFPIDLGAEPATVVLADRRRDG